MGELGSRKQEREHLVESLRAEGKSWVEIVEVLRERYRFNARVVLRYAHGWNQRQAADEWNKRWPNEMKTFKMFSYWEMWPGPIGHAPSFDNLSKLAELYECAVSDLLADLPDFRYRDGMAGHNPVPSSYLLGIPQYRQRQPVCGSPTTLLYCSCSILDHWLRPSPRCSAHRPTVTAPLISLSSFSVVGRRIWNAVNCCVSSAGRNGRRCCTSTQKY
jgi:hypothetical protein